VLGEDFYIELQTSNGWQVNGGDISLQQLLDFQITGDADTTSLPGQSFYSADGTNWTDLYSVDSTHSESFAIDGLTIAVPEPTSLTLLDSALLRLEILFPRRHGRRYGDRELQVIASIPTTEL
jgi:hypothetical protein